MLLPNVNRWAPSQCQFSLSFVSQFSCLDLSALLRPKPFGLDSGLVVEDADAGWWTGVNDRLVESEHYTSEFGAVVAACFEATVQ